MTFILHLGKGNSGSKCTAIFVSLSIILLIIGCSSNEQPIIGYGVVGVLDLSACRGKDDQGKPSGLSKIFSPDEKRIYVCGRLQTNQPITFMVLWYYEGKQVFRDVKRSSEGYFYSFIEPSGETFQEGSYRIEILVGKIVVRRTEFRVEQP